MKTGQWDIVTHTCNPSTQEADAEGAQVWGQFGVLLRPFQKKKKEEIAKHTLLITFVCRLPLKWYLNLFWRGVSMIWMGRITEGHAGREYFSGSCFGSVNNSSLTQSSQGKRIKITFIHLSVHTYIHTKNFFPSNVLILSKRFNTSNEKSNFILNLNSLKRFMGLETWPRG